MIASSSSSFAQRRCTGDLTASGGLAAGASASLTPPDDQNAPLMPHEVSVAEAKCLLGEPKKLFLGGGNKSRGRRSLDYIRENDWVCQVCTALNFGSRSCCHGCDELRPAVVQPPETAIISASLSAVAIPGSCDPVASKTAPAFEEEVLLRRDENSRGGRGRGAGRGRAGAGRGKGGRGAVIEETPTSFLESLTKGGNAAFGTKQPQFGHAHTTAQPATAATVVRQPAASPKLQSLTSASGASFRPQQPLSPAMQGTMRGASTPPSFTASAAAAPPPAAKLKASAPVVPMGVTRTPIHSPAAGNPSPPQSAAQSAQVAKMLKSMAVTKLK